MRILTALGVNTLLGMFALNAQAGGLPLVISATVDYSHNTLTISGQNFGNNPSVTLDSLAFATQSPASSSQIVANFPSGKAPSSFIPGTYFLTVTFKNQLPTVFAVDIGGGGAQGPAGPTGAPGGTGAQGATGPAGPAGPQGLVGPVGPVGATGAAGPAGATGAQGLQGVAGAIGPQGPSGSGGGLPSCTAPDVAVLFNGAFICKSTVPRYVDNGDGTVTDNQSGLMWDELTTNCTGEVTCFLNSYSWSSTGSLADGTLFTDFLATFNGEVSYDPSTGQNASVNPTTCFAHHCDWRIPTISELQSVVLTPNPCGSLSFCIDPVFGPTAPALYWSSTSLAGFPAVAWNMPFGGGNLNTNSKPLANAARAVRTVR